MIAALGLGLISSASVAIGWVWLPEVMWVAGIPWFVVLEGGNLRHAWWSGVLVALGLGAALGGVLHAGLTVFVALLLLYALIAGGFAVSYAWLSRGASAPVRIALAGSVWCLWEWLHVQVPYSAANLWGDSQYRGPLLPLAALGGSYLIGFVLASTTSLSALWVNRWVRCRRSSERSPLVARPSLATVTAIWFVTIVLLMVLCRLGESSPTQHQTVTIVQGGLPTWVYDRVVDSDPSPWSIYERLQREAPPSQLHVWPETAIARIWGEDELLADDLRSLSRGGKSALLVGLIRKDADQAYANSGVLLQPQSDPVFVDKRRLALVAEGRLSPGRQVPTVEVGGMTWGVLFCLETVMPGYGRQAVEAGAEALVVLAEGGRFGGTPVGWVHLKHSVVRGVEVGRAVVHASQHGLSTIISPTGELSKVMPLYHAGYVTGTVPLLTHQTYYVRWGPWIVVLSFALVTSFLLASVFRRLRKTNQSAT